MVAAQRDPGAHATQKFGHSAHGTAAQVRVPGQASREGLTGQKAHEQARRGPGTAGVQDRAGPEEAAPAPPRDPDGRAAAAEPHAQAFQTIERGAHVEGIGDSAYGRDSWRHGGQEQSPVRDGFVAGDPERAAQGAAGKNGLLHQIRG